MERVGTRPSTLPELARFFAANARVLAALYVGVTFAFLAPYGQLAFMPALFARKFDWRADELALAYGVIAVVGGAGGAVVGGWLADRWRSVTRHLLAGVGCDLGQIVFPYLDRCTDLERRKILETVSIYLDVGSLGDTARMLEVHRNTVLNRLNAFEKYTGLDVQRPYDAAAVIIALEWQGTRMRGDFAGGH